MIVRTFKIEERDFEKFRKVSRGNVSGTIRKLILDYINLREKEEFYKKFNENKKDDFEKQCLKLYEDYFHGDKMQAIRDVNKEMKKLGHPWANFEAVRVTVIHGLKIKLLNNKSG